jgi:capsule polysaccharide export protein KpsE/RkpR
MRSGITSEPEQDLANDLFLRQLDDARRKEQPVSVSYAIVRLLWDYRVFLSRWIVRGLLIAMVMAVLIPNRYRSSTRIVPPENQNGSGMAMLAALVGKSSPGLGGLASDMLGTKTPGALYLEALKGQTIEDRLINRFDLRQIYWDRYMQDAREHLEQNTTITEERKSGVITVVVSDRNRNRSTELARAYVEELNRLMNDVSTSSARRERIFIEQRLATVKQDLHNAAEEFSQFASHNTTLDITAQTKATVEAAAALQGQLIAAQSQLDGLEQIYTSNNIRVRSTQARVDELKRKLHDISGQEGSLAPGDPDMPFPSIRKLPLLGVRWAELYQQAKVEETVYELLTQQYEMAKIQEAKEVPIVKVLDEAAVPERKAFPPRLGLIVLGAFLGFLTGSVWICGLAFWQAVEIDDPVKSFVMEVRQTQRSWYQRKRQRVQTWRGSRGDGASGTEGAKEDSRSHLDHDSIGNSTERIR